MKLSIVVPVYNEEGNVVPLYTELTSVLSVLEKPYEVIFVDDGSDDRTLEELKIMRPVSIIRFRKNFGQTAALDAGIKEAVGDIIITMDGDGQNDPADIPLLLAKLEEGYDAVSGWRWQRRDSFTKRFLSLSARFLRYVFMRDNIHDSGCTLKAYRRECFENIDLYGEMHRFIPALLQWQGFRVSEVKVNHRPRIRGKTKYTFSRTIKGFLDIIAVWFWRKYSARPLHLFGGVGLILFMAGMASLTLLFLLRVFHIITLSNSIWPLAAFFMVLVGIQLFVAGLLADVNLKSYYAANRRRPYAIKDIIRYE